MTTTSIATVRLETKSPTMATMTTATARWAVVRQDTTMTTMTMGDNNDDDDDDDNDGDGATGNG